MNNLKTVLLVDLEVKISCKFFKLNLRKNCNPTKYSGSVKRSILASLESDGHERRNKQRSRIQY